MPVEDDTSKEASTPNTNQKKFRKHKFHHAALSTQVDVVLFSKTDERSVAPRAANFDEMAAKWHVLPPEMRDMVFMEYFASIDQLHHILSTPFPSILRTSQEFRQRGLLAFFKQSRFAALLFRHGNENDNFTLPWHRKHANHWLNLPDGPFYMQDLTIRAVVSRCNGCSIERLQDAGSPHCHQLHQIVIRLRSRKKDTEADEYWNRQIQAPRWGQPVYNSSFQHKQAMVYLGHRHLVKRDGLKTAIIKVVEDLFGDKSCMEVQKSQDMAVPRTCPKVSTRRRRGISTFPFTQLPPEIRAMVYKFYFPYEPVLVQKPADAALPRTTRMLREEARPHFFSSTTFVIHPIELAQWSMTWRFVEVWWASRFVAQRIHALYVERAVHDWDVAGGPTSPPIPRVYLIPVQPLPSAVKDDHTFLYLKIGQCPVCGGFCSRHLKYCAELDIREAEVEDEVNEHITAMKDASSELLQLNPEPILAANILNIKMSDAVAFGILQAREAEQKIGSILEKARKQNG
ncbi:hypothetical protein KVT40_007945 [Elsinoe batatas]|uniref:Uncharacterized protein n=1 Tax=Elsinoe batatas TaxID=2601811 RepID=A0A8K0KSE0_9PEZI|nr:hypothetical protein KVT40_007945 [Elsinoe batatas]